MDKRDQPYGTYSEAIPMERLIKLTHDKLLAHANYTDEHIREYAASIVESELCPCATTSQNIVDALVDEVLRRVDR